VTVRNAALLVAVHVHALVVVTEIDADPPEAGNDVVVTPVMIWQPDGAVVESFPQAAAAESKTTKERMAKTIREKRGALMP
jgi:hypothetical protein